MTQKQEGQCGGETNAFPKMCLFSGSLLENTDATLVAPKGGSVDLAHSLHYLGPVSEHKVKHFLV